MSDAKLGSGVSSDATTASPLTQILNAHEEWKRNAGKFMCSLLRLLVNTQSCGECGPSWR